MTDALEHKLFTHVPGICSLVEIIRPNMRGLHYYILVWLSPAYLFQLLTSSMLDFGMLGYTKLTKYDNLIDRETELTVEIPTDNNDKTKL